MSDDKEPSGAQKAFGEFAPEFVHFTDDEIADFMKEEIVQTEVFAAVVDGATHYLAQDIIAALVAGQDAISNRKRRRAGVVGYHATGKLLGFS